MDKIICYFFQGGTVFSDDKLDRAKKLITVTFFHGWFCH